MTRPGFRFAALMLALVACTPVYEMTRSTAAPPASALYRDGDDETTSVVAGGEAATTPEVREPAEVRTEVSEGSATTSSAGMTVEGSVEPSPAPPAEMERGSYGAEVLATSDSLSSTRSGGSTFVPPNAGGSVPVEPLPWVPLDPAELPAGPRRVLLATMEVPPGRSIFPPVSSCQDVLVYVQDGSLEAMGTGLGSTDAPATLYEGDAARFGPEGDGRLTNRSGEPAHALVIIARARGVGAPLYTRPVDVGLCERDEAPDPLVQTMRLAAVSTTPALVVGDGGLTVRILLDLDGNAAEHAGLAVIEGTAAFRVAPHTHAASDEILYVETGDGTFHLGDETIAVTSGTVLYIPEGMEHSYEPTGTEPLRAIQIYAPSGPEQRFRGMAGGP